MKKPRRIPRGNLDTGQNVDSSLDDYTPGHGQLSIRHTSDLHCSRLRPMLARANSASRCSVRLRTRGVQCEHLDPRINSTARAANLECSIGLCYVRTIAAIPLTWHMSANPVRVFGLALRR